MALINIEDPAALRRKTGYEGPAILALGFRPFYLLAAAFAAVAIPVWLASYGGRLAWPRLDMLWHMHEMVYGFVLAVVIGFLYTAGRNWTGLWTPRGGHLGALAALWVAGRVAMAIADPWLAALVDLVFLPLATWPMYRVLARSGNKRNYFLVALLGALFLANAAFHAGVLGLAAISPVNAVYFAIIVIVVIEGAIGGRVIPNFTANAVPGADPLQDPVMDKMAVGLTVAAGLSWAAGLGGLIVGPLALAAGAVQAVRLAGWRPMCTLRNPLLWILHLSYAWIPVGFLLLALSQTGVVSVSAAVHVLGVGALAGLIIGMVTRTALGHTGRPLKAGRSETAMYVLIQLGVLARLVAALTAGLPRDGALMVAGLCWTAAFLLYAIVYGPRLWAPRVDGREG
jgi:uncharacterized protein involved in response to NO